MGVAKRIKNEIVSCDTRMQCVCAQTNASLLTGHLLTLGPLKIVVKKNFVLNKKNALE